MQASGKQAHVSESAIIEAMKLSHRLLMFIGPVHPNAISPESLVGHAWCFLHQRWASERDLSFAVPTARTGLLLVAGALLRPFTVRRLRGARYRVR
ncbi:hypothetical protein XEUV354_21840 [Xanthomonas euvesicatoria]|nr:hypothetical protein XEUV685_22660 [Xanthomonas euvesicatoria]KLA49540.1 hypothetical protein XEUV683_21900 [Xanthomonas euvesicatoria]KLA62453.1 hypothetical protein XEUV695_22715 [Xanthomonas euvesicatoria]KLA63732.1 hypothetical protein XEUV689_19630 [Xanthomonas euvesicatoria]KLA75423.1 hypothetical protein XEUVH32_22545 [Xanthomonas euvesicatoria]